MRLEAARERQRTSGGRSAGNAVTWLFSGGALLLVATEGSTVTHSDGWLLHTVDPQRGETTIGKPKPTKSPGFWYSPDIVRQRDAPMRSMPIKPNPIPPMFPVPSPSGPPNPVQLTNPSSGHNK